MSINIGDLVYQTKRGLYRQGVVYKKQVEKSKLPTPWTYFDILWVTGDRSYERADQISKSADLKDQRHDFVVLQELQSSIKAGASYDL